MSGLTTHAAERLQDALIQASHQMAQLAAITKATLQQEYTLDQLEQRYQRGRVELKELLRTVGVLPVGTPGRTSRIPLDHVLLVDAYINRRLDPKVLLRGGSHAA